MASRAAARAAEPRIRELFREPSLDVLFGGVVVAASLAAYVAHLLRDVGFWDTGVYQAAAPTLGLTHPTGFPTYLLLGWAFSTIVPVGDAAVRMDLLSALCGALAAGALYLLVRRLGAGHVIAAAAGLSFALLEPVWRTAVRADPHTLHILLVFVLFLLLLEWRRRGRPARLLLATAFLGGLAVGNHVLTLAVGPAMAAFVLVTEPRLVREVRRLAAVALAFMAGTGVYLYLPLRAAADPPIHPDYLPTTWDLFWRYVLGSDFRGIMGFLDLDGPRFAINAWPMFVRTLDGRVGGAVDAFILIFAAVGLLGLLRRDRAAVLLLVAAGAVTLYLALTFGDGDVQRYYFLPLALAVAWAALGVQAVLRWRPRLGYAAPLALGIPIALFNLNGGRVDNLSAACYADAVLAQTGANAIVLSTWVYTAPLRYEQVIEGRRPDVTVVNGGTETVLTELDRRIEDGGPIYLVQPASTVARVREDYLLEPLTACGVPMERVLGSRTTAAGP